MKIDAAHPLCYKDNCIIIGLIGVLQCIYKTNGIAANLYLVRKFQRRSRALFVTCLKWIDCAELFYNQWIVCSFSKCIYLPLSNYIYKIRYKYRYSLVVVKRNSRFAQDTIDRRECKLIRTLYRTKFKSCRGKPRIWAKIKPIDIEDNPYIYIYIHMTIGST